MKFSVGLFFISVIVLCLVIYDSRRSSVFEMERYSNYIGLNVPKSSGEVFSCLPMQFGKNIDEKYYFAKCLPYEDPKDLKSTPLDLQIEIENSTPVEEKSSVLYVLDPLYPLYSQICDAKLEPSVERRKEKESGPAEELMTLLNRMRFKVGPFRFTMGQLVNFYKYVLLANLIAHGLGAFDGEVRAFAAHIAINVNALALNIRLRTKIYK
jgi:hypothetical protein